MSKTFKKFVNESEQLQELNKSTLKSYIKKSSDSLGSHARAAGYFLNASNNRKLGKTEDFLNKEAQRKTKNAVAGIKRATERLEESMDKHHAYKPGTRVKVDGKEGEIDYVHHSEGHPKYPHSYKILDVGANDPYKQKRLRGNTFISHNDIVPLKEERSSEEEVARKELVRKMEPKVKGNIEAIKKLVGKDIKENTFDKHKTNIAKKTLRMHDLGASLMGGMSKDEARSHLKKMGWSDAQIKKHEMNEAVDVDANVLSDIETDDVKQQKPIDDEQKEKKDLQESVGMKFNDAVEHAKKHGNRISYCTQEMKWHSIDKDHNDYNSPHALEPDEAKRMGLAKSLLASTSSRKLEEEVHFNVGDKVHAGVGHRGGAGYTGVIKKIDGRTIHISTGREKYGDRVIQSPAKFVSHLEEVFSDTYSTSLGESAPYKVGDTVIPKRGPHKGLPHEVIHVHGDGRVNIRPKTLHPKYVRYHLGAASAKPEDLERHSVKEESALSIVSEALKKSLQKKSKIKKDPIEVSGPTSDDKFQKDPIISTKIPVGRTAY